MKKQIIKDQTYNIYSRGGNVEKEKISGRGDGLSQRRIASETYKEEALN